MALSEVSTTGGQWRNQLFGPLVLGDVTNRAGNQHFPAHFQRDETDVDWKLRAIFAPAVQFQT
jgi:hypothetical protein